MKDALLPLTAYKFKLRIAVFLFSLAVLFTFYPHLLFNPSSYFFDLKGDGLNSWYSMKYHLLHHQSGFTEFTGMNYPFTESIYHFDAQPALLYLLMFFQDQVFDVSNLFVSLVFYMVLFSVVISSLLLLEILFSYGMVSWIAVPFAIGMAFMAPQVQRIYSHIGLAYSFVLPLTWFLYLKYIQKGKLSFVVLLVMEIVLTGFLHPYYLGLSVILLFILVIIEKRKSLKEKLWLVLISAVIPVVIYLIVLKSGFSGSADLARLPYGSFGQAYRSRPEDVFTPNVGSYWYSFFGLSWIAHASWEGEAFLGFVMLIPGISFLLYFVYGIFRSEIRRKINPLKTNTGLFLFPMLLFIFTAGALHYVLPLSVKNAFPSFISQFRAFGRISWVIFYMLSIFFILKIYAWYRVQKIKNRNVIAHAVMAILVTIYAFDVTETNTRLSRLMEDKRVSLLNMKIDELGNMLDSKKYQAIMPLPYFHKITSLPNERDPANDILWPAYAISLKTGLPITGANASRTSQTLGKMQLDLFINNSKEVLSYYPSTKPLLLITTLSGKKAIENGTVNNAEIFRYERFFLEKGHLLKQIDEFLLYEISFNELLLTN